MKDMAVLVNRSLDACVVVIINIYLQHQSLPAYLLHHQNAYG